ncbi:MAG: DUF92 domain-containing protein [Acidobacteria bacterium]|nr:DUF92 domain-containing protein [Acidobacteriota bacterium]
MGDASIMPGVERRPIISTRKVVHISMLAFAFLLPFLTWGEAAGAALLALCFNLLVLPRLGVDLQKRSAGEVAEAGATPWTGILAYPISVLALILLFGRCMEVVAAAWAIMALGDGLASVVGVSWRGPAVPWNRSKTWSGFLAFIVAGSLGSFVLARWVAPSLPELKTLILCIATAIVGAVVETIPIALDDNFSVPLICGAFMFCASLIEWSAVQSNLPYLGRRILLALAINGVFALGALGMRMVNRSGAALGFLLGIMVYMGYGYKSFLILLTFFFVGSVATRLGYAKKAARGHAEGRGGARSWREATANTLAGAFFAILVITTHYQAAFLVALVAAFAEAAGDTTSSEIGQWLTGRAYLITTFKPVPAGENGGVSVVGSLAGLSATVLIVVVGYALGLVQPVTAAVALGAGIVGNLLDSVLGATIERRGLVNNGVVNFIGSSFAGGLALGLLLSLHIV